jgi:hypothetical protein
MGPEIASHNYSLDQRRRRERLAITLNFKFKMLINGYCAMKCRRCQQSFRLFKAIIKDFIGDSTDIQLKT